MIHADVLMPKTSELCQLAEEGAAPIESHFSNMGLCMTCLMMVATIYADNMADEFSDELDDGDPGAVIATAFIRGVTVGLVVGREYPIRGESVKIETQDDEIRDGMLRWEPGTLSTKTLDRLLMDVLADIWRDCYRRGDSGVARISRFNARVATGIRAVLGNAF